MKPYNFFLLFFASLIASASGNVGIFIHSGFFKNADNSDLFPSDGLMQLINLGEDGVLGSVIEGSWVGGDDILIDLPFGSVEFGSSGAFDTGELDSGSDGVLSRFFDFALTPNVLEEGDALALRWWPQYKADDFHNAIVTMPMEGDLYGEFRLAVALTDPINNTAWLVPSESIPVAVFDPLISAEAAGSLGLSPTPGFTGEANQAVLPIPEPAHYAALFGVVCLAVRLFKRSKRGTHHG